MSTQREEWYDSDDPERFVRGAGWFGLKWGTIFVVGLMLISTVFGVIAWSAGVFTSDIKGRGDRIKENNSNLNRTGQQQQFEDLFAQIKSLDQRVELTAKKISDDDKAGRNTEFDRTNLSGMQNVCLSAVGNYNANARKILARDWLAADLPQEIDNTDPATDCQPASTK